MDLGSGPLSVTKPGSQLLKYRGYEQLERAMPHTQVSNVVQTGKAMMESSKRSVETAPGTRMTTSGLGAAMPMEENGEKTMSRNDGVTYEREPQISWKHIPDFEEVLKDIDGAIHNYPMVSNSKATDAVIPGGQIINSCNLVDIGIMDDDPSWENQMLESRVNQIEGDRGAKNSVVEFNMGRADKGLSGVVNKCRPTKKKSKRKPKTKPKSESVVAQNKILTKVGKSPKQGTWIIEETRRPNSIASPSLELRLV